MKKINKKGFTIVELVIVIAVIAILAAVLIPTFSSLVKTAQTSSDVSLVKNLNTSLTTSEILDGKNETMTDALNDVKEDGFDVTKLTPTNSDNEILWDEESNRFVLYVDEEYESCGSDVVVDESKLYKLWKIYNEIPELDDQTYSIYYVGEPVEESIEIKVGFDSNVNVNELVYESNDSQNVIIRTNSVNTSLTVNASTDTVNHYGKAGRAIVEAVDATHSYHEFGEVVYIEALAGHIVLESSAIADIIYSTQDSGVSFEMKDGATINHAHTTSLSLKESLENASKNIKWDYNEDGTAVHPSGSGVWNVKETVETIIEEKAFDEIVENNPNAAAMTDNKVYDSVAEAIAATQSNEIIILRNADIKASDFVDKNITLIGNENVLTLVENSENNIKTITTKGTLTIDLNGKSLNSNSNSVISVNEGTLNVIDKSGNNSGLINSNVTTIEVIGSSNLNVTSGTIKSTGKLFSSKGVNHGAIKNSGSGIVNISGGTFNFTVDNGSCAMLNTGSGKIIANGITIGDSDYSNIGAIAVNAGAGEVDLTNVTFYVNPNSDNPGAALLNMGSGIMNITNCTGHTKNGSMIADGHANSSNYSTDTSIINIDGGTYTCTTKGGCGVKSVGNGTINIDGNATFSTAGNDSHGVYVLGSATINIENANIDTQHIDSTQGNENMAGYAILISDKEAPNKGSGNVTINGGTFNGYVDKDNYGTSIQVVCIDYGCSGSITIKGGTFNAKPEVVSYGSVRAEVIAEGYHAVDNGNGTYTVVPITIE